MYEIDQETIRFSNGKLHRFKAEIAESLEFEDCIVIRLSAGSLAMNQNIFGLDYNGNLLWKIPTPRTFDVRNPYVSLFRKEGYLEVMDWDGHLLTLHPKQGSILSEGFYTGGPSSNRAASRRVWM